MGIGICRLKTRIRSYHWGSRTFLSEMRGEARPSGEPEAELWVGVHPQAPSQVEVDGRWRTLQDVIAEAPDEILGASVARRFDGRLPFLLKVLAVAEPLSLQLHPDRKSASSGFEREEEEGLAAADRTYHDPRHKPELVVALTPFSVLRDLRPIADVSDLLARASIPALDLEAVALRAQPDDAGLRSFLRSLFALQGTRLDQILEQLRSAVERLAGDATFDCIGRLLEIYPRDPGVLSPLFMHRVELEPGEALFQPPGMLHCYLEGAAVEVMADSDNVARAALTSKRVDVDEVLRLLAVEGGNPELVEARRLDEQRLRYAPAVDEFTLTELALRAAEPYVGQRRQSVELWVCVEGEAAVSAPPAATIRIRAGESVLVPAAVEQYSVEGSARIYIASVP